MPSLASYIAITILVQEPVPEELNFTSAEGYTFNVTENTPSGFVIGQVMLEQIPDYVVEYISFTSVNPDFYVNRSTGEIETLDSFDYEEQQIYVFEVQANMIIPTRVPPVDIQTSIGVTVYINDANDNLPIFANLPSTVDILENISSDEVLFQLRASDSDSGINKELEFSLLNQDLLEVFRVNMSTGEVYTVTRLDREMQTSYSLLVRVNDLGSPRLSSDGIITVILNDVNDNPPVLSIKVDGTEISNTTVITVNEDTEVKTVIANVTANDNDIGDNAEVMLSLVSVDTLPFNISSFTSDQGTTSGSIVVSNRTSLIPGFYVFEVLAEDNGQPRLSSTVQVTVRVLPEQITFPLDFYEFTVSENTSRNALVGNVSVEQMTPALDGLVYSIVEGNEDGFFTMNSSTGVITTQQVLDRETHPVFNMTIMAALSFDSTLEPETVSVSVVVEDVNDNAPMFTNQSYFVAILVNETSTNTTILQVEATDLDSGTNALLSYSVEVTSPQYFINPFNISSDGRIITTTTLNATTYRLNVTVKDMGSQSLQSFVSVSILVQLPVPESLQFTEAEGYRFNVSENSPSGSIIGRVLLEELPDHVLDDITFSLNSAYFRVLPETGHIQTLDSFDYEETREYEFVVSVRMVIANRVPPVDIGTSVNVTVEIKDENDNRPVFLNLPSNMSITENQTSDVFVYDINAIDSDSGINEELEYSIVNLDLQEKFYINSSTGELYASPSLDREEQEIYVVIIQVNDLGTPRLSAIETVTVRLTDINDNAPILSLYNTPISPSHSLVILTTDVSTNFSLVRVLAVDPDFGSNSIVSFSVDLLSPNLNPHLFEILDDGSIFVTDTNLNTTTYYLNITAQDMGIPRLASSIDVTILVQLPIPENLQFSQQEGYAFFVSENIHSVTVLGQIELVSLPSYVEEYISFTSLNSNFFVNRTTGVVETLNEFDYEDQQIYMFTVTARMFIPTRIPPADTIASVNVTVYINDINDNPPVFVDIPSNLTILENQTSEHFLYHIVATDADSGINQLLDFSILNQDLSDKFYINSSTGDLYAAASLDREEQDIYSIIIGVNDLGTPRQSVEETITIKLEDINDNAPILTIQVDDVIIGSGLSIVIDDETEPGDVIANITAIDHDVGINSAVYFEIDSDDALPLDVHVSRSNEHPFTFAEVVLSNTASPLVVGTYSVTIRAINIDSTLSVSDTVLVTVTYALPDEISFTQTTYEFSVLEHSPRGTVIGNVSVEQMTPALNDLQYVIVGGSGEDVFEIDSTSGIITVRLDINREVHTLFNLTLIAHIPSETSLLPAESSVTIFVLDINDNTPTFPPGDYVFNLPITQVSINDSLIQVTAIDHDVGSNAHILYNITTLSPSINEKDFYIVDDGRIFTTSRNLTVLTPYIFSVTASNIGFPHLLDMVIITLTYQIPTPISIHFTQQEMYEFNINENTPPGIFGQVAIEITTVLSHVTDNIRYSSGGNTNFYVDPVSGDIQALSTFDYETSQSYLFEVSARLYISHNIPPIDVQTSTNVTVLINDVNDNIPNFVDFPFNLTQFENRTSPEFLYHISATDSDSGSNQELQFEIINHDLLDKFTINSTTGELRSTAGLDRETQQVYYIIIQVSDMGTPMNSAQEVINFTLLDVNDNVPRLIDGFEISVHERSLPQLPQLTAFDPDLHLNGMVEFYKLQTTVNGTMERIDTNEETRVINISNSGELYLYKELDFEVAQWYNIHIRLTDLGNPPLQFVYTNITLLVIDEPDNPPQFERDGVYQTSIFPTLTTGETIAQVRAIDADPGDVVTYEIESIHHEMIGIDINISINALSGRVFSAMDQSLNPDDNFTIGILGYDNSQFRLVARATINVIVLPERLQFPQLVYAVEVSEDAPLNTEVIRIPLEHLSFSSLVRYVIDVIDPMSAGNTFTFSGDGEPLVSVLLNDELDRETQDNYAILVTALRGNDTVQTTLLINVTDVNDNAPVFVDESFEIRIPENTPVGREILVVNVTDADVGTNSNVQFSISSTVSSPLLFSINETSGQVSIAESPDHEESNKYVITVTASDNGSPPLHTSQNYTIMISNQNDNYPQFSAPAYFGEVYARAPCYAYIHHTQLQVNDRDDIDSGQKITFSIFPPVSSISQVLSQYKFEVRSRPPYYIQVVSLPEEADLEPMLLELRVQVTDEGGLSSQVPLYISIFTTANILPFELNGVRIDTLLTCEIRESSICAFREELENAAEIYFERPVTFYNNSARVSEKDCTIVQVDMFGWYETSDIRSNNGELSSHLSPPPVEYITYDDYLVHHPNIGQSFGLKNVTFNVTLVNSSALPPTVPPPIPEPFCVNDRILYAIAALAAVLLAISCVLVIFLIRCYRSNQNSKRPHQPSRYIHRAPSPTVDSHHDAFEMYRDDPLLDTTETTPWYFDREYVKDNISLIDHEHFGGEQATVERGFSFTRL